MQCPTTHMVCGEAGSRSKEPDALGEGTHNKATLYHENTAREPYRSARRHAPCAPCKATVPRCRANHCLGAAPESSHCAVG